MAIEECGGLDKIEELQNHQSDQVYTKAYRIVEHFFSELVRSQFGLRFLILKFKNYQDPFDFVSNSAQTIFPNQPRFSTILNN